MQSKGRLILFVTTFTVVFGCLTTAVPLFAASKEKVLYRFCSVNNCTDGEFPKAGLIFDAVGNLYGTATSNNALDGAGGTVFELTPNSDGMWTETVLYSFCSDHDCTDGDYPEAGLIFDAAGNLYGTTSNGGASGLDCDGYFCGTVFQLTPSANGQWTETVLYNFCSAKNCKDGANPTASPIFDTAGNIYGTTTWGGAHIYGTVFQLTPGANGQWTETLLHSFGGKGKPSRGGLWPSAGMIFDTTGNLYSTTPWGGAYYSGTVFELTPGTNGQWTEKVLHSFTGGGDGGNPYAAMVFDAAGNLYGTTYSGGAHGHGTVFQLTPGTNGKWKEKVLHSFSGKDGRNPVAAVIFDAAGNLYGTTYFGGTGQCKNTNGQVVGCGVVFELMPGANGKWTETVLHRFGKGKDGKVPSASLISDAAGNLYGTTEAGGFGSNCVGNDGCGTIFEITP